MATTEAAQQGGRGGANPSTFHKEGTRPSLRDAQAAETPSAAKMPAANQCLHSASQPIRAQPPPKCGPTRHSPKKQGSAQKVPPQGRRMPAPGLGTGSCVPCQTPESCSQRNWLSDSGVIGRGHNHPAQKCKSGQNGHTGRGTVGPQLLMPARAVDHPWAARHH